MAPRPRHASGRDSPPSRLTSRASERARGGLLGSFEPGGRRLCVPLRPTLRHVRRNGPLLQPIDRGLLLEPVNFRRLPHSGK
jgi:hypothetical protein